jgi:hypothetical protein
MRDGLAEVHHRGTGRRVAKRCPSYGRQLHTPAAGFGDCPHFLAPSTWHRFWLSTMPSGLCGVNRHLLGSQVTQRKGPLTRAFFLALPDPGRAPYPLRPVELPTASTGQQRRWRQLPVRWTIYGQSCETIAMASSTSIDAGVECRSTRCGRYGVQGRGVPAEWDPVRDQTAIGGPTPCGRASCCNP